VEEKECFDPKNYIYKSTVKLPRT